jgi:NRAMP (natural resistance-associated macrophage protein)-like metal ion transporter
LLGRLGPGLITGASDDDPSGIATYSQTGAQFGYAMCWVMLFCFPLMVAIQEISARMGRVTGQGIAGNIHAHYSRWLLYAIVGLLLLANTINLGADLGAMAAALKLLAGGPAGLYTVGFAIGCVLLQVFSRYERYVSILKWTSFVLLAYVAVALVVHVPWGLVLYRTFVPNFSLGKDYVVTVVAKGHIDAQRQASPRRRIELRLEGAPPGWLPSLAGASSSSSAATAVGRHLFS